MQSGSQSYIHIAQQIDHLKDGSSDVSKWGDPLTIEMEKQNFSQSYV